MVHNIRILCRPIAIVTSNFYQASVPLYVVGAVLLSSEGTTQGDPLAMPLYALAVIPLIGALASCMPPDLPSPHQLCQLWYADDACAAGRVQHLRTWWDHLTDLGPPYGYHPNVQKTWLVVKEDSIAEARIAFANTGVQITTNGWPYLGAPVGTPAYCADFLKEQVSTWCEELHRLTGIAKCEPQAAYAALIFGLQHRWTYAMRTSPWIQDALAPLEQALREGFLPTILQRPVPTQVFRQLLSQPIWHDGLGSTEVQSPPPPALAIISCPVLPLRASGRASSHSPEFMTQISWPPIRPSPQRRPAVQLKPKISCPPMPLSVCQSALSMPTVSKVLVRGSPASLSNTMAKHWMRSHLWTGLPSATTFPHRICQQIVRVGKPSPLIML